MNTTFFGSLKRVFRRDKIWSLGGGAGFGNWFWGDMGVFKSRCGFLGFGVGGCGF